MADVLFKLDPDLAAAAQDEVLARISALPGVAAAAPIKPDAARPSARALCYARVAEDAAEAVAVALQAMPEVLSAQVPPRRGLA